MASALIIPGVQVRALFEPSPVLPGATGILGAVGITDRGPLSPNFLGRQLHRVHGSIRDRQPL